MYLFLHIPKTAGTTFQLILENNFGITYCHLGHLGKKIADQKDLDFTRKFFPWLRSISGENLLDPLRFAIPDPFYMTILREPVARTFSYYQDEVLRGQRKLTFEEMLKADPGARDTQVTWLAGQRDLDRAKMVLEKMKWIGLTEKFDLSLQVLNRLIPKPLNMAYRRKVVARDNSLKKSLEQDPRMIDIAREFNRLDLELYDFATREIFPGLCARAGLSPTDKVASFETEMSDLRPNFLLSRFYNQTFFRQVCKVYRRRRPPQ